MKQVLVLLVGSCVGFGALTDVSAQAYDRTTSVTSSEATQRGKKRRKGKAPKAKPAAVDANSTSAAPVLRRSNRMEFDGRLVKGEKADGAVYLFQKATRPLPALLKLRRHELDKIVWPVLRRGVDAPVVVKPAEKPKAVAKPDDDAKAKTKGKKGARSKRKFKKRKRWRPKKKNRTKKGKKGKK